VVQPKTTVPNIEVTILRWHCTEENEIIDSVILLGVYAMRIPFPRGLFLGSVPPIQLFSTRGTHESLPYVRSDNIMGGE